MWFFILNDGDWIWRLVAIDMHYLILLISESVKYMNKLLLSSSNF